MPQCPKCNYEWESYTSGFKELHIRKKPRLNIAIKIIFKLAVVVTIILGLALAVNFALKQEIIIKKEIKLKPIEVQL